MRRPAALAALLLALWGSPARSEGADPEVATVGDVAVSADSVSYDWQARRSTFRGNVRAVRGNGFLRADRGTYDAGTGMLTLAGGVFGVQEREVFVADEAVVDVNAHEASLRAATLFLKDRAAVIPQDAAHARAGKNALVLTATSVRRLDSGVVEAGAVTMTPCDCAGQADYQLESPKVSIEGDRARLEHPSLRLLGASVPLLLPLSLPLTDRQSGLLFPPLAYSSTTGFGPEVPVFVTLGRSYDATLGPGFFTGSGSSGQSAVGTRSVVGPRFDGQLRYAPFEGTAGHLDLDLVQDLRVGDSRGAAAVFPGEAATSAGRGFGGLRGIARFDHRSELPGWLFSAKGTAASDAAIVPDIDPPSQLDRYLDSLRTDVGAVHPAGPLSVGADATLLQDVRIPDGNTPDRRLFGAEARSTFQRLPSAFLQLAPVRVGAVSLAVEASAARFASLAGTDAEERATGFAPTDLGAAAAAATPPTDGVVRSRERVFRLDVAPRAFWESTGGPILVATDLGGRADAWFFDGDGARNRRRAYASGGVRASSSVERNYGAFLHSIEPALEVRAISPSASAGSAQRIGDPFDGGGTSFISNAGSAQQGIAPGLPLLSSAGTTLGVPAARRPYDEIDGAAPESGEALARMSVAQAIWTSVGKGRAPARVAQLEISQDVVLWDGAASSRLGEAGALLQLAVPRFSVQGRAQFDWGLHAITQLSASSSLRDDRGDELHGGLGLVRGVPPEGLRAGIDELFGAARIAARPGDLFGGPSFGGSFALPLKRVGLRAGYDAAHYLGQLPPDAADWTHSLGVSYDTPCRCAGLQLSAAFFFRGTTLLRSPIIHLLVDLKSLGSFATF